MFCNMKRLGVIAGAVVACLLFAGLVWPTKWDRFNGNIGGTPVSLRADRFTGQVEVLGREGWRPLRSPVAPQSATAPPSCSSPRPDGTRNMFDDPSCP
jgi:hypothetical protein